MPFIGIDVQSARPCPYAVVDEAGRLLNSGWLESDASFEMELLALRDRYPTSAFGVDSPRVSIPEPRLWYWSGGAWHPRTTERGYGRHCEVVIKAHRLANPQWTPLEAEAPEWMKVGFRIFSVLEAAAPTYEAFPSASYSMLQSVPAVRAEVSFESFAPGPKDMLDAVVSAVTVREFQEGRGQEVGGGDGLGSIVLPRPLDNPIQSVLSWPDQDAA